MVDMVVAIIRPPSSTTMQNSAAPRTVGAGKYSRVRTCVRSRRFGMASSTMNSRMAGAASGSAVR